MANLHQPVLCEQVVDFLQPAAPGVLVDATVGLAGHACALLAAAPGFRLIGCDRDQHALAIAAQRLAPFGDRVQLVNCAFSPFSEISSRLDAAPSAVLADLGCSSLQLDTPERGFSFAADGPLDMRMGPVGTTAADLVNQAEPEELVRILREYGEERQARAIVRAVLRRRLQKPLRTTGELAATITAAVGSRHSDRIHPATRSFMALRIAVNDELGQLERFITPALRALGPGGRIAIISFHSLEDRIVKHTLRRLAGACTCPPGLPQCACGAKAELRLLTTRPVRPDTAEVARNPRARSARLRVAERIAEID